MKYRWVGPRRRANFDSCTNAGVYRQVWCAVGLDFQTRTGRGG